MTDRDKAEGLRAIGAVVAELTRTYPDVTHSSLRFLEREGLIAPPRTPGGHRLYTPADVARIRQIKAWQAQRLSLEEIRQRLLQRTQLPAAAELKATFFQLALAGDHGSAFQAVLAADDGGVPLAQIFGDVLQPALIDVGQCWEEGDLPVAQEKEISELTRELIVELSLRHADLAAGKPQLVAACVEGERHELGLRMICGLLRADGYAVHFLGADVAARYLAEAVQLRRPAAILLSATLGPHLFAVKDAIETLRAEHPAPLPSIIVGGRAAAEHTETIRTWGAIPVPAEHPTAALAVVEASLFGNPQPPLPRPSQ